MVLGRIFIAEESLFVFDKPTLAPKIGKYTKGKVQSCQSRRETPQSEENARKKGATNDQLSTNRRAEEASCVTASGNRRLPALSQALSTLPGTGSR